jgi:hypothetical protein
MRNFTYLLLGLFALQSFIATPALADQKVKTFYEEISSSTGKTITASAVAKAFKTCSAHRGWKFTRVAAGKLIGQLNVRGKHYLEVDVAYNAKAFKISYKGSKNMRYNAEANTIHKRYNSWVSNLSSDVLFCLK